MAAKLLRKENAVPVDPADPVNPADPAESLLPYTNKHLSQDAEGCLITIRLTFLAIYLLHKFYEPSCKF